MKKTTGWNRRKALQAAKRKESKVLFVCFSVPWRRGAEFFQTAMRVLLFLLLCPYPAAISTPSSGTLRRIAHRWALAGESSPFWLYDFNSPHLRQQVVVAGTVVADQSYIYGTSADTLWASGPGGEGCGWCVFER